MRYAYLLPQLVGILKVHLMEGLDVVGGEGNGHHHHVLSSFLGQGLDHLVSLGTKPWQRTNLEQEGGRERERPTAFNMFKHPLACHFYAK